MTDAEQMAAYAREHFGMNGTPLEIGRALVAKYSAGPRSWCGVRILRSLGILIDGGETLC
ncbi:MAG: hypothetical protein KKD02_05925 [Alphaproteobacteria bacterium]|nr:hypothetical protein [Alphaproteobacteria bacterium]